MLGRRCFGVGLLGQPHIGLTSVLDPEISDVRAEWVSVHDAFPAAGASSGAAKAQ
jgi:hypothetical protein